nr:uncharacterized protein LOC109160086 isoform X6 [Ipomoea batatas]GMD16570.1 uncharacterized protein LOC109160086 isoform X6 [Ipomoea batatas]GMD16571.1 uncharacterized protein LOC109160086 isoform X6 [Ipomoea batatas]GMD20778.1 uncharacterized protein LOC109160086 isoform X6 [Ipomoea batatas]
MNLMLSTVAAMAAVAKAASTAYYYAEHFGVFNREAKGEAETRSVEVAVNQSADVGILRWGLGVVGGIKGLGLNISHGKCPSWMEDSIVYGL